MDDIDFSVFSHKNRNCMLFQNVLSDGVHDFYFVTTYLENIDLEKDCIDLENKICDIYEKVDKFNLKRKYKKVIEDALLYYCYEGVNEQLYSFDTFKLFLNRFKEKIFSLDR